MAAEKSEKEPVPGVTEFDHQDGSLSVADILVRYPSKPFYRNRGLVKTYLAVFPGVLLVSSTVGYDGSMLNGLQSVDSFASFFKPSAATTGLLNASLWIGSILAFPIVPFIADRWGRKVSIGSGAVVMIIGTVLQGAAQNIAMFVIARIILGIATSQANSSAPILVAELAHPRDRKVITALHNGMYYLGAIAAAWITFGTFRIGTTYGWRIPSYLQGIFAVINLSALWFVPESPRWLVSKDRVDEAKAIIANAHTNGDLEHPLVAAQLSEIFEAIKIEQKANKSAWRELFRKPQNRKRLILLIFIGQAMNFSGNGLVSYYLSKMLDAVGITSQKSQTLINGILQIVSFVTCLVGSWAAGWVRRRTQFLTSTTFMFFSFLAITIGSSIIFKDPGNKGAAVAVIFFVFFFQSAYNWAFNSLAYSFPIEFLPYNIRVVGIAFLNLVCYLAGFFNTFVNPIALEGISWKYYIVYVIWLAFEGSFVFFVFPETLGQALEEVSGLLDNDRFLNFKNPPSPA